MFQQLMRRRPWSEAGRFILIGSACGAVLLSLADGILYPFYVASPRSYQMLSSFEILMLKTWITDFRYLCEQGVLAGAVILVGAKFIETRTLLSVAFDKLDAANMSIKGPDASNTIWIGRRYGTQLEAEAVAAALQSRMQESAAADN